MSLISCRGGKNGHYSEIEDVLGPESSKASLTTDWLNSINDQFAKDWYLLDQGSNLIDWDVFLNLEQANSTELFATEKNLIRYGFVYPPPGQSNWQFDKRLPLGFTKEVSRLDGKLYLGFNCAACHSSKLNYKDRQYLIHAGSAPVKLDMFLDDLKSSFDGLKFGDQAEWKRERLIQRILTTKKGKKENITIQESIDSSDKRLRQAHFNAFPTVSFGPGRIDAIGWIFNTVFSEGAGIYSNHRGNRAPINIPFIWRTHDLKCVQTNCVENDPMLRNVGEAIGVFGTVNLKETLGIPDSLELLSTIVFQGTLLDASPKVGNLYKMEEALKSVTSPLWGPTFPAIDRSLAVKGRGIFRTQCEECHVSRDNPSLEQAWTIPNAFGKRFVKVKPVRFQDIGTDPEFHISYSFREATVPVLKPLVHLAGLLTQSDLFTKKGAEKNPMTLLSTVNFMVAERYFRSREFRSWAKTRYPQISEYAAVNALKNEFRNYRTYEEPIVPVYKARPLDGIAFTAPYLHNGSVPTLKDLLEKPEKRPTQFRLGAQIFDPIKVGLVSEGDFVFDTNIVGNRNTGHEYGVNLSEEMKIALLEYLKTL